MGQRLARAMDERKDGIGEHAAELAPPWAVAALGPLPEDPRDRLDWRTGRWNGCSATGTRTATVS